MSQITGTLLFKEAGHIKEKCPILNNGDKVFREMQLVWVQFSYNEYTNHVLIVSFCSDSTFYKTFLTLYF